MVDDKKIKVIDNLEIYSDHVIVSVNPKIYTLDVVYSAAYVLIDRAYIVINGDPEEEIIVEIRAKDKTKNEEIGRDFNNELINYAVYKSQSAANQEVKDAIVKRALLTNIGAEEMIEEIKGKKGHLCQKRITAIILSEVRGRCAYRTDDLL